MRRNLSIRTAALLLSTTALAASASPSGAASAQTSGRERTLYVSVVDGKGAPVTDLSPRDLIVREDGVRREVLSVSPATGPIDIAVLVDNSSAATDDIRNIRDGLTTFVEAMHDDHPIAIVGLADRPTILADYTRNLETLKGAIGRLFAQPGSGMRLLDALVEVSRGMGKREGPRAVILPILTDGTEFSTLHYQHVLDALRDGGAALHAVTIGSFSAAMDDELRNRATVLDRGPRQSGGQRITLLSSMGVGETLQQVAAQLNNQLKVVYGRPDALIPPERVEVAVNRPGLEARGAPERRQEGPRR